MNIAVVFDSAGTLLHTCRVVKDILHDTLLHDVETTNLTFADENRALLALHASNRDILAAPPDMLISSFLIENDLGFGVACTRRVIPAERLGEVLYSDTHARVGDLQVCIRDVLKSCRKERALLMDSGVILNMKLKRIEYTLTSGGKPFKGAKETISRLHSIGVAPYIASGDRVTRLEELADYLGIPRDRVFGFATPLIKAQIIDGLRQRYDLVVMVGDGINDLLAMKHADVAILTSQQNSGAKPDVLYKAADYVVDHIGAVVDIVAEISGDTSPEGASI